MLEGGNCDEHDVLVVNPASKLLTVSSEAACHINVQ
jgi:hypothetical protein